MNTPTTSCLMSAPGRPVRAFMRGSQGVIEGYGMMYGTPEERDLYRTYFSPAAGVYDEAINGTADGGKRTWYGYNLGDGSCVYVQHRSVLRSKNTTEDQLTVLRKYAGRPLRTPVRVTGTDDVGIIAQTIVDMRDEYEAMLYQMAEQNKLSYSSATMHHTYEVEKDGRVRVWDIGEYTLTPTPGQWRDGSKVVPTLRAFAHACDLEIDMEQTESGIWASAEATRALVRYLPPGTPTADETRRALEVLTDPSEAARIAAERAGLDFSTTRSALFPGIEASMTMQSISALMERMFWAAWDIVYGPAWDIVYGPEWDGTSAEPIPERLSRLQSYALEFTRLLLAYAQHGMQLASQDISRLREFADVARAAFGAMRAGKMLSSVNANDVILIRDTAEAILTRAGLAADEQSSDDSTQQSVTLEDLARRFDQFTRKYERDARAGIVRFTKPNDAGDDGAPPTDRHHDDPVTTANQPLTDDQFAAALRGVPLFQPAQR